MPGGIAGLAARMGAGPGGRSNALSSWKPEDFRAARAEFDPRLADAIATLGPARASSEKAAVLLVELLAPPPGSPPPTPPAPAPTPPPAAPPNDAAAAPPSSPPAGLPPGIDPSKLPEGFDPAMLNNPRIREEVLKRAREQGGDEAAKAAEQAITAMAAAPAATSAAAPQSEETIVAAIIESLGANRTEPARQALRKLLLGEIKTGISDGAATGLAARAILLKPSSAEQELIAAAAVDASKLRPGKPADPALQAQVMSAIEARGDGALRAALADMALRKSVPEEQRKALLAALLKPSAGNLAAQAKLLQNPKIDAATRAEIDRQFAAHSTAAINRLLGLSAAPADPAVSGEAPAEATMLRSVIDNVWGEEVVARLDTDATAADDFADFAESLPLAVAMPVTRMRTGLANMFHEHWEEGPDELKLGTRFGELVQDPGVLLITKRMPRKEKPPEKKGDENNSPPRSRQRRGRGPDGTSNAEKQEKARHEWMRATEEFVQSLNARFLAAAEAGAGQQHLVHDDTPRKARALSTSDAKAPAAASRAGRFPLELPEDAKIVAEYHVCWPEDLPKRLGSGNVAPLSLHYVKLQNNATMTKLNTHFLKQLKGGASRKRPYGRWLDWYGQGVQRGQARTVDVMIERDKPVSEDEEEESTTRRTANEEPEDMTTEILVVEIPEYKTAPGGTEEVTNKLK